MAVYTLPDGVTAGNGVLNVVNVYLYNRGSNFYPYNCYHFYTGGTCASVSSESPIHIVGRYTRSERIVYHVVTCVTYAPACSPQQDLEITFDSWCYDDTDTGNREFVYPTAQDNVVLNGAYGTNCATSGISQYPSGYAPIPTTNVITVGSGKDYSTLADAVAAASHGDNIVLDAGTHYVASTITIDKCIRIYGATEDPADVIIRATTQLNPTLAWRLYGMSNVPEHYRGPGLFHISLQYGAGTLSSNTRLIDVTRSYYTDSNSWNYDDVTGPGAIMMFSCNT